MKAKIFLYLSLMLGMGVGFTACDDDADYTVATTPLLTDGAVVTGSADVTATTAALHGTVKGLEKQSASSFTVGFKYGYDSSSLTQSVSGSYDDGTITAELSSLADNTTIYYQAFVTLAGTLTYTGEIKTCVTTDCQVLTGSASAIDYAAATVSGSVTGATADATYGVVFATSDDTEAVRAGLIVAAGSSSSFSVEKAGLVPSTTYYYAAYADLGNGVVYGDIKSFTTASYEPTIEDDMVDLGLSVSWAKLNIGARSESEMGGLFGYGDVTGVANSIAPADYASSDITGSSQDVAKLVWNGKAKMPTAADYEELFLLCSYEWTEVDGVGGYRFTGPNGNSIFLPAAGSRTINDNSSEGVTGLYATGTVNSGASQYAVAYEFNSTSHSRTSVPVYEALAVRPVTSARSVPLNPEYLYTTWAIDYSDGSSSVFAGPVYFYGTDDSWGTITNGEDGIGDNWAWEADASNTWAFGNTSGTMTLNEDGTIAVTYPDGSSAEGTYTIDIDNKTITSTINLLTPETFPGQCSNQSNELRIFSLTDEGMQIAFYRDADPCLMTVNYIHNTKKVGYAVSLNCADSTWNGTWGAVVETLTPSNMDGTHTFHIDGSIDNVMVFTLDFEGLNAAFPDAIICVKEIRCDGNAIAFDANRFFYGDIEGNGNYRIEFFNAYGKGANGGVVSLSPFSELTDIGSESNFSFTSSLEMDYVVIEDPTYTPTLITINPSWGGPWDYTEGATTKVVVTDENKLGFSSPTFDITYSSTEHSDGSIMTFIQTNDLFAHFPGVTAQLDDIYLDGTELTGWDPSKIINCDADGGATHHRLELWNMYGTTASNGCAFGTPVDGVISELGFSSSMRLVFTFTSLF